MLRLKMTDRNGDCIAFPRRAAGKVDATSLRYLDFAIPGGYDFSRSGLEPLENPSPVSEPVNCSLSVICLRSKA